ncbi:alpha/beta hydrolase family protein [Puia sp. P3]|uniref:alpha/beta hydrolase family protein n=1 Tax=Puia sp. P3 TaxID=3423952 RepID=UPI003D67531D
MDESAVFLADRVTTPLLLVRNRQDELFQQGTGLFAALRRLGKKVWMLQYDQEGHVIGIKRNQIDFTIRITQFFGYYLKGELPPVWMTRGVPAKLKGIQTGLELDNSGLQP